MDRIAGVLPKLTSNKLDGPFAHDIVQAASRVNYMSNLDYIHGLGAMVICSFHPSLLFPLG